MTESRLYAMQRLSAVLMAPMVITHLITIMIAVRGGLTAEEILARTQGFSLWAVFYTVFVIAVAIHAPLGLRKILIEWMKASTRIANGIALILSLGVLALGLRAVIAVTGGGV